MGVEGLLAAPANDNFEVAADLGEVIMTSFDFDSEPATRQVGESAHAGADYDGTIWWKWTAPGTGSCSFGVEGGTAWLVLYRGTQLTALTEVASTTYGPMEVPVVAGEEYRLVLASELRGRLNLEFTPAPASDDFEQRTLVNGSEDLELSGSTRGASRQAGEPDHAGDSNQGGSIWWELVPAEDALLSLDLADSESPAWNVAIYRGTALDSLELVASRNRWSHDPDELTLLRLKAGERLVLAAARDEEGAHGTVAIHVAYEAMPQHDAIEDGLDLGSVAQAVLSGDLTASTGDLGSDSATVWWRWTAPANGVLEVHRAMNDWVDPAIYQQLPDGSFSRLSGWGSGATSYVFEGETFWIQGGGSSWDGAFSLDLKFQESASNDDFNQPAPLTQGTVAYDPRNAGPDRREDVGPFEDPTLWWIWTAPADGLARFTIPFGTLGTLYLGDDFASLVEVTSPDPGKRYEVAAGTTYRLRLSGFMGLELPPESFEFRFDPFVPDNDDFADAADLGSVWIASSAADGTGATLEAGEPTEHLASVWWKWTAPADAVVYLTKPRSSSSDYYKDPVRTVYAGASVDALGDPLLPRLSYREWFSAVAGQTYHIAVPSGGPVNLDLEAFPAPPPNDDFADSTDLGPVLEHRARLSFVGATTETGEPEHDLTGYRYVHRTRWWSWTAPADLNVALELGANSEDHLIGVYEGGSLGGLVLIDRVVTSSGATRLSFAARAGHAYRIVLAGGESPTPFSLRTLEPPAGDRFDLAVDLGSGTRIDLQADTAGATADAGEPEPAFDGYVSLWWRWTAPGEGLFEFESNGGWRLFEGSTLAPLDEVLERTLRLAGGEELVILYQGYAGGITGADLDFSPTPGNDGFAMAEDLGSVAEFETSWAPRAATVEAGEPDPAEVLTEGASPGTVWWKWTAPDFGILRVSVDSSPWLYGGFAAVHEGAELDLLKLTKFDARTNPWMEVPVFAGRTYWLQTGYGRCDKPTESARLSLSFRTAPTNDIWEAAFDLGGSAEAFGAADSTGASKGEFEDSFSWSAVWWKWTAPATGTAYAMTDVGTSGNKLEVWRDDGAGGLVPVPGQPYQAAGASATLGWMAEPGVTYHLAVAGASGPVEVRVALVPVPGNDRLADAFELDDGVGATAAGTTLGAGVEPFESAWTPVPGATVWYEWTALEDGWVALAVGSGHGTQARVFTSGLEPVTGDPAPNVGWFAEAGTSYRIAVVATGGSGGTFELRIEALAAPANDAFADRILLSGAGAFSFMGHNLGASAEAGEPAHAGAAAEQSIWYEWVAPFAGALEISVSPAARLAVYTGGGLDSLSEVAAGTGTRVVPIDAGETYRIAIDSSPAGPGIFELALDPAAAPLNNDLAGRTVITGYEQVLQGDLHWADVEAGEPVPPFRTLWWEWTAPFDDEVELVRRSGILPQVRAYTSSDGSGSMASLRPVSFSLSYFRPRAGTTYYFQVGTSSPGASGVVDLILRSPLHPEGEPLPDGPPNDHFADRLSMGSALPARGAADPLGATFEVGEPYSGRSRPPSLWWSWTAPSSGVFALRSTSPDGSTVRVFRGGSLDSLTSIASAGTSWSLFTAEAGVEYPIAVYANSLRFEPPEDRDSRMVAFEIEAGPGPAPNDDFAAAIDLGTVEEVAVAGSNVGATAEPGEPAHAGVAAQHSVWWEWTAPGSGSFEVSALGAVMRVGVYQGAAAALTEVATGQDPVVFEAVAGTRYALALDADGPRLFTLRIREVGIVPPPVDAPNDAFADAIERGEGTWSGAAGNFGSTFEPGEPLHAGDSSQSGSVWWRWTAPADGPVSIRVAGLSAYVSVYLGESIATLVPVVSAQGDVRFRAEAGVAYAVAVSGTSTSTFGTFELEIDQGDPAPVNDDFDAAIELVGEDATVAGTTAGASLEPFEPRHDPDNGVCPASVWYRWTSPVSDLVRVAVSGTGGDCVAVYEEGPEGLVALARAATAENFVALGGRTYWIAVAGSWSTGAFELSLRTVGFPPNDAFADRIVLPSGGGAQGAGSTLYSTLEAGEPNHGSSYTDGSVWWSWTAVASGWATLDFRDSPKMGRVAVYTGDNPTSLVSLAHGWRDTLEFSAVAGTTYQIAVAWTLPSEAGEVSFSVVAGSPSNDEFEGRIELPSALPVAATRDNFGATARLGDPAIGGATWDRTLWWQWRAPADGWVDLDYRGASSAVAIGVFSGPGPGLLQEVETIAVGNRVRRFLAKGGGEYLLVAGSTSGGSAGEVAFNLQASPPLPGNDLMASAIRLAGEPIGAVGDTLGAGLEPGDPIAGEEGSWVRSLWWRWQAPRSAAARLESTAGAAFLYQEGAGGLELVESLPGGQARYPVEPGRWYWIGAATREAGPVGWSMTLGPAGDLAGYPVELGAAEWLRLGASLRDASWERLEPFHAGAPAVRSVWFRWTAPYSGRFRIAAGGLRVVAYEGETPGALSPRSEGSGEVFLQAVKGTTYRWVVDTGSAGTALDFELQLHASPDAYESWRVGFFGAVSRESLPGADPDGDGWSNGIEQVFLGNPLVAEPDLVDLTVAPTGDKVAVELVRPWDFPEGAEVTLEVSRDLQGWQSVPTLDRIENRDDLGGGWSRYRAVLTNFGVDAGCYGRVSVGYQDE